MPSGRASQLYCGMVSFRERLAASRRLKTNCVIIDNFLSSAECAQIIEHSRTFEMRGGGVRGQSKVEPEKRMVKERVLPPEEFSMTRLERTVAESFGVELQEPIAPRLLFYEEGGHYIAHNDAGGVRLGLTGPEAFRMFPRDLSTVLYLNEEFTGGEFEFVHTGQIIRPTTGMLTIFPSDWRHEHRVLPITSGERWAVVNWYTTIPQIVPDLEPVSEEVWAYYLK